MPSPRQHTRPRRGWDDEHRWALIHCDYFRVFAADDEKREAWHDLRDEILTEWIREHPFTRPRSWWEFDAPEMRR
jgi:hypothetical protein